MEKGKKITKSDNVTRQITEIKSLAEYMEKVTSIPSVTRGLDRHLERMASIPSVTRGLDRYLEQMASATATLDRLSKLETPSSLIRTMAEANKSILAITAPNRFVDSMVHSLGAMESLRSTLNMPAILSTSLAAQLKLSELQRFPLGSAINAAASLQDSLRLNLSRFTATYRQLVDFTDHQPSIIEVLEPDIIQYPSYEVFREAELLEQITVPEDEQVVSDEYEVITIPEEGTLEDRLGEINSDFPSVLQGARAALNTDNPERARHVTVSLRELVGRVLHQFAPNDEVKTWSTNPSDYDDEGKPTRRARLLYICREINFDPLSDFVDIDVKSVLALIKVLNAEAHVIPCRLTDQQLQALVDRTESCLLFLFRLDSTNE